MYQLLEKEKNFHQNWTKKHILQELISGLELRKLDVPMLTELIYSKMQEVTKAVPTFETEGVNVHVRHVVYVVIKDLDAVWGNMKEAGFEMHDGIEENMARGGSFEFGSVSLRISAHGRSDATRTWPTKNGVVNSEEL